MRKRKIHTCIAVLPLIVIAGFVAGCMQAERPALTVPGVVTDEEGKPLAEVKYRISGVWQFRDGAWGRRSGYPQERTTDRKGRFVLLFYESNVKYDLQFDKAGYAPSFLYDICADSEELKVLMKRGMRLCGTVTRLVDGERKPVSATTVTLRLPAQGFWYVKRTLTVMRGEYMFRVSPPPRGRKLQGVYAGEVIERKWQVVYAGEIVEIDVKEGQPIERVDFEVNVTAKRQAVEQME